MAKQFIPYDKQHKLHRLLLVCVVVNDGQENYIIEKLYENEAYLCFCCSGRGTASSAFYEAMGVGELKKDVIYSFVKEERWPMLKKILQERFGISKWAQGIAFACPIDAISGVSVYKMLSNTRFNERKDEPKEED